MYIPEAFAETDPARLHALIRRYDFAVLVTVHDGAPFASHLPVMLDDGGARLIGHMARANPQWRHFESGAEALAIFQGPHGYVSPTWYAPAGPSVPTWNYAAVHVYGIPRVLPDEAGPDVLRRLTALYENDGRWSMDALPGSYLRGMLRGIVPFEIPIARIEGKLKLSQNRPVGDRVRVADGLERRGGGQDVDLARMMRALRAG